MEKNQILEQTGLDWTVRSSKVVTECGYTTDKIAMVRNDNNEVLGVHSKGYVPYQNGQLQNFCYVFHLSQVWTSILVESSVEVKKSLSNLRVMILELVMTK